VLLELVVLLSCVVLSFNWCDNYRDVAMASVSRTDKKSSSGGGGGPFMFIRSRGSIRKELKRQHR
jgi:hypothetical protein